MRRHVHCGFRHAGRWMGLMSGAVGFVFAAHVHAEENVSAGGRVESDLDQNPNSPPAALIDGDAATHFAQHRLEDSDWRLWLRAPSALQSVTFVQGWPDWSQAQEVRLEIADGTTVSFTLKTGTRAEQTFPLTFSSPTAWVDAYVTKASPGKDGNTYGGFAEMRLVGSPVGSDTTAPKISGIAVQKDTVTTATVTWTTDEPATSQVRYSTEASASQVTPPSTDLVTQHTVKLDAGSAPLRGQIEIRSADGAGNRAEVRNDAFVTIDTSFQVGVGGWSFQLNGTWVGAPQVYRQDDLKIKFTQAWVGSGGWTSWFTSDSVAKIANGGFTPEVIHYFFGDPVLADVLARKDAFLADITTLAQVLKASGVGDKVLVTLEPEYNQGDVAKWDGWNDLMIEAIRILRSQAGCRVGLLPGDWDIDHVVPISMGRAAAYADFVAFQEMRASTKDSADEAAQVVDRAIRFSHYLSRKFLRPVRLGYLMVSDYGGWARVQRDVVIKMCERSDELRQSGLVAISWMSYLDSDSSGGYFDQAESYKGLKYSNNEPKPAWYVWKECVANGPSWLGTGQEPPGAIPPDEPPKSGCSCSLPSRRACSGTVLLILLAIGASRFRRQAG